ncbi:MAG: acyl carrier protein [Lachnospiraceae bacterium]|nr:acyl carrier protein [Lachnospiraceae bacterium]
MFEQVKKILAGYTEVKEITKKSQLRADLELSSFDLVSIITEFEETFDIDISDRDLSKFVCVEDILEYLELHA